MSTFNPIFDDDSLFGSKLKKTSCPSKSDICGNLPGTSVLDSPDYVIPKCSNINFKFSLTPEDSPSGCCVVDTSNDTCGTYIPESATFDEEDYNIGIQFLDASGLNPRQICHSAPIRERVIKLKDFFIIIVMSALIILSAAIIGACYEFWLKYGTGDSYDCSSFIYKKCGEKIGPIQYAFPSSLAGYPYTKCDGETKLGFPYFVVTYFNLKSSTDNEHESVIKKVFKIFGLPVKAFCLNFLYTLVFSRKFISYVLETLSNAYLRIGNAPLVKNIIFLFLTGLLFNVIAHITKIQSLNGGPGFVLYILSLVIMGATIFTLFLTNFILYWWPGDYDKYDRHGKGANDTSKPPLLNKKFGLVGNVFYALRNPSTSYYPNTTKLKPGPINPFNLLKNIGLALLLFIPVSIAFTTGMLGSMIGLLYMTLSLVFNIFYIPLSNTTCFLNLIKDHGDLLTILFCISIIVSSVNSFNSTTSGIIGGLVGVLILYKIYKAMHK